MKQVAIENVGIEAKAASQAAPESALEQLSALHDGELSAHEALQLVRASLRDESLREQWQGISVVSQLVREASSAAAAWPAEPAQIAPEPHAQPSQPSLPREAANDGVFRWKLVAGVAALAAVGSLVWTAVNQQAAPSDLQAKTQSTSPAITAMPGVTTTAQAGQEPPMMIRDPRLDELLAAHKQFGGASALQQPAGSLRNASFAANRP